MPNVQKICRARVVAESVETRKVHTRAVRKEVRQRGIVSMFVYRREKEENAELNDGLGLGLESLNAPQR
jgi:hypothetical protein